MLNVTEATPGLEQTDLNKAHRLHLFNTLDDPAMSPSRSLAKEAAELIMEGTKHEITHLESGHLCCLPYIPACDRSFMVMSGVKFIFDWSRNKTAERKAVEAAEYERFYNKALYILNDFFH